MSQRHQRLAALLLALLGLACQRQPIKLGGAFGLSGRHYDLGVSGRNGATLAVEQLNASGGIDGRALELLIRDDQQNPEVARHVVQELIDQGVVAIVGHMTSSMTEATLPLANAAHVLLVSPTTSASTFQGLDDWLVMVYPSTRSAVAMLVDRMLKVERIRRLAVVYDLSNRAFSEAWLAHAREGLAPAGAEVVAVPFTSGEEPSMGDVAARALAPRPDAVLVVANSLDTASVCQQVRKRSARVPLFGSDWGFTQDAVSHGGKAVEGAIFTLKVNMQEATPDFVRFRGAYQARFGRPPDFASLMAFEAVLLVAEGLRRDTSREGLRRALLSLGTFQGLQEQVRIDRFGDMERRQFLMTVRDGRIVPLE
jgi:branched-chain amino acid transport system substrate-binding protein